MRRWLNDHHSAPFSGDNAGVAGTRSTREGVSRLSVVPRGPYLRYLCVHMTDTSGMPPEFQQRYSGYRVPTNTDTQDRVRQVLQIA